MAGLGIVSAIGSTNMMWEDSMSESLLHAYGNSLHPPLVLLLCITGAIAHFLAITTLSSMLNPTNAFLISMSCSQLALCANFLYSTFFKWASDGVCIPFFFNYYMTKSMHISVTLSALVNMSAVFHVVALSIIRYFSLAQLSNISSSPWFTFQKCRISIAIIYISVAVLGTPLHFTSEVVQVSENAECAARYPALHNATAYQLQFSSVGNLKTVNFWLFNLCAKIIPSIILCIMTYMILKQLQTIRTLSARFTSVERDKQHNRTTQMILIIMFIFILVEFPQGILQVLSTFTDITVIYYLGDIFEMLTLLTSCVIFGLFCSMNSRLRQAIASISCFVWMRQAAANLVERRIVRSAGRSKLLECGAVSPCGVSSKNNSEYIAI